jgi:hypothetical protein
MVDIADLKDKILQLEKPNTEISNAITGYKASYNQLRDLNVEDHDDLFDSIDGEIEKLNIVKEILHSINIDVGLQRTLTDTSTSLIQLELALASASASAVRQPPSTPQLTTPSLSPRLTSLPSPPPPPSLIAASQPSSSLNLPPFPSISTSPAAVTQESKTQVFDIPPPSPRLSSGASAGLQPFKPHTIIPPFAAFTPVTATQASLSRASPSPPLHSPSDSVYSRTVEMRNKLKNTLGISPRNIQLISPRGSPPPPPPPQLPKNPGKVDGVTLNPSGHAHLTFEPQLPGYINLSDGSKFAQVGGDKTEYELTPGSDLYVRAVTALHPISSPEFHNENPDFDKQVKAGIIDGSITPVSKTENEDQYASSQDETSDDLSPAHHSADNPEVIKKLIMNLKVNPVIKADIIQQYEQLVFMCQRKTALELIKPLLKPEKDEIVPSDRDILTTLGWNGSENELLYDINKRRQGQIVFVNGLFSFFCFDKGEFAAAFSRHCGKNYACMLNWVLIVAFRLRIRDPANYTDTAIIELIKNMHYTLYGFLLKGSIAKNFTKRTDGNADFYIRGAKDAMKSGIFYDVTLASLVGAIKVEVNKIPEPNDTLSTYFPRKSSGQTTVKSGGGDHKTNKLTRKRHHRKIHKIAHTIKVTKNPTTTTKKTRRHVSHVKT